jgi:hypothetical protein
MSIPGGMDDGGFHAKYTTPLLTVSVSICGAGAATEGEM